MSQIREALVAMKWARTLPGQEGPLQGERLWVPEKADPRLWVN